MIAAVYARKSTAQDGVADEAKSLARQVAHARAYAEAQGWAVDPAHVYQDDAASGAEFAARDGLMRLLASLRPAPPFAVLVVMHKDRLGREQYESAYNLKRLAQAGVRVFEYLGGGRELKLTTPTEKFVELVGGFAAEQERYQASLRTRDALRRKAERGHVTGGRVFGYRNVPVVDAAGRRDHVRREVVDAEAAVVRRIFAGYAGGLGFKSLAIALNAEGAVAPLPRRHPQRGWAPSSVRAVIHNPLYTGAIVWGRARKRDDWGAKRRSAKPEAEWVRHRDEALRIVPDALWAAAHERLASVRDGYLRHQDGRLWGRPANGKESPYLLTGLAACGVCAGSLYVVSGMARGIGRPKARRHAYWCAVHKTRGAAVCANGVGLPIEAADGALLAALESSVLDPAIVEAALDAALDSLAATRAAAAPAADVRAALADADAQLARLAEAVRLGGGSLLVLVREIATVTRRRDALAAALAPAPAARLDRAALRRELGARLADWTAALRRNVPQGRQLLRRLLVGRVVFTPGAAGVAFEADCSLGKLIMGLACAKALVTPAGSPRLGPCPSKPSCAWQREHDDTRPRR